MTKGLGYSIIVTIGKYVLYEDTRVLSSSTMTRKKVKDSIPDYYNVIGNRGRGMDNISLDRGGSKATDIV